MGFQHRIAVVDDELDILENYRDLLGEDYQVETFSNPLEFLKSMEGPGAKTPDLVITDLNMPGLDGIKMVQQAQQSNHHFPVILLSGFLNKEAVMAAVDIGVYRLLEKPTPIAVLKAAIDQLLIEHDVYTVRREVRQITGQLRELYSTIRLAVLPYIPEDVLKRMVLDAPAGGTPKKMSFEDLLEALESRLDQLLRLETVLTELRERKYRN